MMMKAIPCICDSGILAPLCCWRTKGWYKSPATTVPLGPVTGYSHPNCYAGRLGDCSHQISGEHIVPHAILKQIGLNGINRFGGMHWQTGPDELPGKRLVSNVLCERHNRALSPVDKEGARFFQTIDRYVKELIRAPIGIEHEVKLFNGEDIERLLVKCACVYIKAGNTTNLSITPDDPLPDKWIAVLFGGDSLSTEHGMRFLNLERKRTLADEEMGVIVWQHDHSTRDSIGATLLVHGLAFWHTPFPGIDPIKQHDRDQGASRWKLRSKKAIPLKSVIRPQTITLHGHGISKVIHFSWSDYEKHEDVHFTIRRRSLPKV